MIFWILVAVFLLVAGFNWWVGSWNSMINLINFFIASLVASSFFENLANQIESINGTYRLVADFVAIWILFVVTFVLLRVITDFLTRYQMRMNIWVEYSARSILSLWLAVAFVCFASFTLNLAPLPPHQFGFNIDKPHFGFGPDRSWMAFVQSRSRGALSESQNAAFLPDYDLAEHPDDEGEDVRVFDPFSTFEFRNLGRRLEIARNPELRVAE